MLTESLRFHCTFTSDAGLPAYKGSALRGAFGHALKKVGCALHRQKCEDCILAASCCYCLVFESKKLNRNTAGYKIRLSARPHPYVLEPPMDRRHEYLAGESFSFTLHLFGPALRYRPQIFYAVTLMGKTGLGKGRHGKFNLDKVTAGDVVLYDATTNTLSMERVEQSLAWTQEPHLCNRLRVDLLTPLRIKRNNCFQRKIPFGTLIRSVMRRISSLETAYGEGEPDLDYRGLAAMADGVDTVEDQTEWQEIIRYSNRQGNTMKIGGVLGSLVFEGDLEAFLPLLRYCEVVHLGKQTTFGLGLIRVSES